MRQPEVDYEEDTTLAAVTPLSDVDWEAKGVLPAIKN